MSDSFCGRVRCDGAAEIERLRSLADSLGEDAKLYLNQLTHTAGFIEGMAFRIEQHMLDKTMAADDLRDYAKSLRKLVKLD
jgi:hypothetical protein